MKNIHNLQAGLPPTTLTIFGATGDLSADYLMPALFHMHEAKILPKEFRLVCVGRRDFNEKTFLNFMFKKSEHLKHFSNKTKKEFLKKIIYFKGDFSDPNSFKKLPEVLADVDKKNQHTCFNRLYYFATNPHLFSNISHILKDSGLLTSCGQHGREVRVLLEKPFGSNLKTAQSLNSLLLKYFQEKQVYRIDHYQGKETVQNLIIARFANTIFEPLWNSKYIDHIEISVLEKDTAKERAEFYDQTGALKDMVQNHILQMLALILMDEPKILSTEEIHKEKLKVLESLQLIPKGKEAEFIVRGQYEKYLQHLGKSSQTETLIALKIFSNLERWQGVPIFVRTGKALNKKVAEVSVHFKEPEKCLFKGCAANILTFRIQPDESVTLQANNKIPGFGMDLHQAVMEFSLRQKFTGEIPPAYERLLLDFLQGDQRLFIDSKETESSWKYIDQVTQAIKNIPMSSYKMNSRKIDFLDNWIQQNGRTWHTKI